jgi:farnesyl diphosphate synthase
MVGGQMLDLAAEGRFEAVRGTLPEAEIRQLQAMKTGALLAASVEIGARLGGADAAALAALGRYGRALGATFQIADDILDVESDAAQMGKATAKDADKGKGTLLGALGLIGAKRERDRLSAEAMEALAGFGAEADVLRAAARFAAQRKS